MSNGRELVERLWKCLETNRIDEIEKLVSADCHFKMPGCDVKGFAAMKGMFTAYIQAFPDLRHRVKNAIESGDTVALELEVTGTHTGPMQTPKGIVAPTNAKVAWESCDYVRIENGKVVSWHAYYDSVPFMAALGLIPS